MGNIHLSEKHGVNPSLLVCPFCGKDTGVALLGRLQGDREAPKRMLDRAPCSTCQDHMREGVILLSVQDGWDGSSPAPRTGRYAVVKDEAITRVIPNSELASSVLKARVCHMEDRVFKALGLVEETESGEESHA